jgi:hypothetical protein
LPLSNTFVAVKGGTSPVYIRGLAKFAKLTHPDQFNKHSIRIYPNQETMPAVHKLISEGVKNRLAHDDDGYSVTFSRPIKIETKTKGEVLLPPLIVTDEEDHILDDKVIPDGTDVTIKLECYGGRNPIGLGTYKAARLAQIKIHGKKAERSIPI